MVYGVSLDGICDDFIGGGTQLFFHCAPYRPPDRPFLTGYRRYAITHNLRHEEYATDRYSGGGIYFSHICSGTDDASESIYGTYRRIDWYGILYAPDDSTSHVSGSPAS